MMEACPKSLFKQVVKELGKKSAVGGFRQWCEREVEREQAEAERKKNTEESRAAFIRCVGAFIRDAEEKNKKAAHEEELRLLAQATCRTLTSGFAGVKKESQHQMLCRSDGCDDEKDHIEKVHDSPQTLAERYGIALEEVHRLTRRFEKFDTDNDGGLDCDEFIRFLKEGCRRGDATGLAERGDLLFSHADNDNSGSISLEEILEHRNGLLHGLL